jgi:hypothetical protein
MSIEFIHAYDIHGALPYLTYIEQEPTRIPQSHKGSRALTGLINGFALGILFWIVVDVIIFTAVHR